MQVYLLILAGGDLLEKVRISFALWALHALCLKEGQDFLPGPVEHQLACS